MSGNRLLWAGMAALVAAPAFAADTATVREVERVVKVVRAAGGALSDASIGAGLAVGDRVRTGGRSAAGIRFADATILRIGELSQLRINGSRRSDAALENGELLVDAKKPMRIQGSRGVAAVRGTIVHFIVDQERKEDTINCYDGQVFVSTLDRPIVAGTASDLTPTSLTDPDLQDPLENYTNGEIRFVEGPYKGQIRRITRFDNPAGRVEWALPLDGPKAGAAGPNGYVLVQKPDTQLIELRRNTGTRVRQNLAPDPPAKVPSKEFARLDRHPFFRRMHDRLRQAVYSATDGIERDKDRHFLERQAIRDLVRDRILCCFLPNGHPFTGPVGVRQNLNQAFVSSLAASGGGGDGRGDTPADRALPLLAQPDDAPGPGQRSQFRFEPYALGANDTYTVGGRLRYQGVSGNTYFEVGYRYADTDGQSQHFLNEGFFETRGPLGDLSVGRQHRYIGPANNTDIGTLLGLESIDAVVYNAPLKNGFTQEIGYVWNSRTDTTVGFKGGYARGQAPLLLGNIGYSAFVPSVGHRNVGWSADVAQPLIRNVLDAYGEGGVDTENHRLVTAGFYVPYLYHRAGIDVFLEYARREDVQERVSLRVRREVLDGLLLVGFVDRDLGSSFYRVGGGVMWSKKFR